MENTKRHDNLHCKLQTAISQTRLNNIPKTGFYCNYHIFLCYTSHLNILVICEFKIERKVFMSLLSMKVHVYSFGKTHIIIYKFKFQNYVALYTLLI